MTNDIKDRYVLAAAVHAQPEQLVTSNIRHFPPAALAPYGIFASEPDRFLAAHAPASVALVRPHFGDAP